MSTAVLQTPQTGSVRRDNGQTTRSFAPALLQTSIYSTAIAEACNRNKPPSATISLSHGHAATAMSDRERRFLLVIEEGGLMREFPSSNSAGLTQKGRSHGNRETKWKSARRIGQLRKRS